jgi:uncharacterized protein GlcG (DUF336 family)
MVIGALLAVLAIPLVTHADEEAAPTVSVKRLTMEVAEKIAQAAVAACRQKGIQTGVTVVDRNGLVQVVLRDTVAPQITVPISRQKAFTAASFNVATSQLQDRAETPIGRIDGFVMYPGGVPVQAGGYLLGGVGVSGSPDGETDEECARAGLEAVLDDLEMGG